MLILLFTVHGGQAQNFPVRVTPILTPPYTPFLTDYTDPGAERLTIQVILNDLTVPEFRARLRLTIEGVGITITTSPNYFPPPITLQGGVPQIIYGSDIADYFKISNMVFQGLNPNEVQKNGGRLPEGVYRLSFEVLDYNRNTVVSNKGSATAWMILNDPPFINLPVNNAKLKPLNPQNIVFQWTPRHRGSPNAAFTTDYDVKLVEIWPAGRNPFDAINTSRPILEITTSATLLVYGPAETPLVLGREYALQVRARDNGGRDVFKNNGYSEVIRFIYGDECPMPGGLNTDDINIAKARMRWQGSGQNSDYLLRYREKKDGARWFEERTNQSYFSAKGLRAGTTYEYQVRGECDIYQSEYASVQSFSTLAENPNAFVCADPNSVPLPDGSPPLPVLFTNDFIHAGGFDVVVNKAIGSNGRFTGEGLAVVPWFNSAKVRVTFENIDVNTSYQLTGGEIKSVWDANSAFLVKSEKTLAEGGGKGLESKLGTFEADSLISLPGIILGVSVHPESGEITVDTRDGPVVIPREEGKTYAITDEAGNGYLVDKEGKITKTTATDAQLAGAKGAREYSTDPDLQIEFRNANQTRYGLDDYQTVLAQNYQQTENGKYVSWKALATGQTENVAAVALGNGDISKANFRLGSDSQPIPNTQPLTLIGKTDGMVDELLAYYPNPDTTKDKLVAGKLNLISYDIEKKNLVLVSVNSTPTFTIINLQQELNKIYGQGVVEWTSVQQQSITVNGIDAENIDDGGSGLLSNYTEDMKKILRAYTADNTLVNDTYYLFLVKNSTSKNKLGYMPRKRQAGFIFVGAHNNEDIIKTIAHELGHGAFHLKHSFSEYPSLSLGVTENLMDYPAKTRLDKWQWDHIHNPETVMGLFEDDEEGALVATVLTALNFKLYDGDEVKGENSIFTITASPPAMPDIRGSAESTGTIKLRLKIEYIARKSWTDGRGNVHTNELVREDVTWFPSSEWQSVTSGEIWDVDFGNSFRGGKAYLFCNVNDVIVDTITFYIRGENPSEQDTHNYVNTLPNSNGWWVPKMIRQESSFRQFNTGNPSSTNTTAGFPNWGPPYGWGMKQLDNLGSAYGYETILDGVVVREGGASPDELWNWQLNVQKGIQFFNDAKMPVAVDRWDNAIESLNIWLTTHQELAQDAYPMVIVASPVLSELNTSGDEIIAGNNTNFETIVSRQVPLAGQRSLIDAHACKFYNGGNNYFTISIPSNQGRGVAELPHWNINKLGYGRDYVNDISGRPGW